MADVHGGSGADTAAPAGRPRSGLTLLVVEDHEVVRHELEAMLTLAGLHVVAVATAGEGRRAAEQLQPDMAVIDTGLPDGSGIDLCRDLRRLAPRTATILHTATLEPGQERSAHEAGAFAVVLKAIDGRTLMQTIERRTAAV